MRHFEIRIGKIWQKNAVRESFDKKIPSFSVSESHEIQGAIGVISSDSYICKNPAENRHQNPKIEGKIYNSSEEEGEK